MHSIEILKHTADIGIRARADTMEELFAGAAMGLESIALELEEIEPRHTYSMSAVGEDSQSLLVNWLNEVIYYLDGKRIVMARFDIERLNEEAIVAHGWGEPWDPKRHRTRLVVKAATYHQLKIARDGGQWGAEVYLDI